MIDHCYIKVSKDKYEHIVAIADTAKELAEICNTSKDVIYSAVSHNIGSYKKVLLDDQE